jgi:hypothetical protein
MNLVKYFSVFLCVIASSIAWAKNCVKGIPCGRTCIAAWKTCHIPSSYQRISEPVSTNYESNSSIGNKDEVEGKKYLVVAMNGTSIALKDKNGRVRGFSIFCRLNNARDPERGSTITIVPGNVAVTAAGEACSIY